VNKSFIKSTKSLCPVCLKEIDTQLFLEDGKITIVKECESHGTFNDIVDPKAELYLRCVAKRRRRHSPYGIVIPISNRCNLHCKWCYLPDRCEEKEPSFNSITRIISNCRHKYIVFSGGEPTLRDDLPELIAYVRKNHLNKFTVLLTNGIKLADISYLKRLKDSGLHYIIFSLNGFRKETHLYFSDQDLRVPKRMALKNLKRFKIWTILSTTLAKNVNEDEFHAIYKYGIRNIDFIRQIRLRNVSEIGIYRKREHIYLSDMVGLVSQATGFSMDEMYQNNSISNLVFKTGNYFVIDIFETLKNRYGRSIEGCIRYWLDMVKLTSIRNTLRMRFEPPRSRQTRLMFRIEIFSWPSPGNIDLLECRLFCIDHLTNNGEILPFWEALYKNEKLKLRTKENHSE
jgi:uncharacterized radical SAM superfamily Fe-S cluster-containing enzyme